MALQEHVTEDMVERGTRALYEYTRSGLTTTFPSWDKLVEVFPDIADKHRGGVRAALNAALNPRPDNEEEN